MALSGTFQNYPVSSFGLYCEWSGAQSVTANYTDVTLKVYLSYYTLDVGARSDSTISINGVSETYTVPAIEDYSSGWKKKLLKTKTVRVSHNYPDLFGADNAAERHGQRQVLHRHHRTGNQERKYPDRQRIHLYLHHPNFTGKFGAEHLRIHLR